MNAISETGTAYSDYRASHQGGGYGAHYAKTYDMGYYAALWSQIEQPLLESVLMPIGGPDRSCLDFACGTGRIASTAAPLFGEVAGVDVSQSMLERAQAPQEVKLTRADITRDPLPRKFDVVTAFRFFLNAEDVLRQEALKAIHAHLHEGGYLVANIHMNATSPTGFVCRVLNRSAGQTIRNTMSIASFEKLLIANGFAVERTIGYGYLPRPGNLVPRLCEFVVKPFEVVSRRMRIPARLAQHFLVVARKE